MAAALEQEQEVKISRFGTFFLRQRKGHLGRNPKTGELHRIPPHRSLWFRPTRNFVERVNSAVEASQERAPVAATQREKT